MIIGICGGTGSGKTTVANKILENIDRDSVALLQQDNYYKELANLPVEERARQNFDQVIQGVFAAATPKMSSAARHAAADWRASSGSKRNRQ